MYFACNNGAQQSRHCGCWWLIWCQNICINTLRPRQNGHHFADDIFRCIFLNENVWNPLEISLTFVPKGPINNMPTLVQVMTWRRPGHKPLSEPMMVSLSTHICVTRPQWVNYAGADQSVWVKILKFDHSQLKILFPHTIYCCPWQLGLWGHWGLLYCISLFVYLIVCSIVYSNVYLMWDLSKSVIQEVISLKKISVLIQISFCSHPNSIGVIATQFCTCHDSCAVVVCAKFCCNILASKWDYSKNSFPWNWNCGSKSVSEMGTGVANEVSQESPGIN